MERVWRTPQDEAELGWGHEQPGTTTLLEADGTRLVGAVSMTLVRMLLRGEEVLAGIATRLATDPEHRGRGVFSRLQRESERRAEAAGARRLVLGPNAESRPIFLERLGWSELEPIRVRLRLLAGRRAPEGDRLPPPPPGRGGGLPGPPAP